MEKVYMAGLDKSWLPVVEEFIVRRVVKAKRYTGECLILNRRPKFIPLSSIPWLDPTCGNSKMRLSSKPFHMSDRLNYDKTRTIHRRMVMDDYVRGSWFYSKHDAYKRLENHADKKQEKVDEQLEHLANFYNRLNKEKLCLTSLK